jgi:hypothetical protein
MLEPAQGFQMPTGDFDAALVRFNETGEVVHIEFASAESAGCRTQWVQDASDRLYWYATCAGACTAPGASRALTLDRATLELSCGLVP